MSREFTLNARKIDWDELRDQKLWLIRNLGAQSHALEADGLLNFLDHIQDEAVRQGAADEAEVFPSYKL